MQNEKLEILTKIPNNNIADVYYYARILPKIHVYEVLEMKVRAKYDGYFVALDSRDKTAYLFDFKDIDNIVFEDRDQALAKVLMYEEQNVLNTE